MKWIKSCHLLYSIQATKDSTEFCIANSKSCWVFKQLSFHSRYYCDETFSVRLKSKKYHHLGQVSAEQFKLESTQFSSFYSQLETIQILRQQRGGWVWVAKCWREQKIRKKYPRKKTFLCVSRKKKLKKLVNFFFEPFFMQYLFSKLFGLIY